MVVTGPASGPFGSVHLGSIVTFTKGDVLVTHRIVSVVNNTMITKGDANNAPDTQPLEMSQVTGVCLLTLPKVGYLSSFIQTRTGWLLLIVLPALVLVAFIIKAIIKEALRGPRRDVEEVI